MEVIDPRLAVLYLAKKNATTGEPEKVGAVTMPNLNQAKERMRQIINEMNGLKLLVDDGSGYILMGLTIRGKWLQEWPVSTFGYAYFSGVLEAREFVDKLEG